MNAARLIYARGGRATLAAGAPPRCGSAPAADFPAAFPITIAGVLWLVKLPLSLGGSAIGVL